MPLLLARVVSGGQAALWVGLAGWRSLGMSCDLTLVPHLMGPLLQMTAPGSTRHHNQHRVFFFFCVVLRLEPGTFSC